MKDAITECQYIGSEQKGWPYVPCGHPVFPGKSYCEDHVWIVYQKGTSSGNKRKLKEVERELAEIKRIEEIGEIDH